MRLALQVDINPASGLVAAFAPSFQGTAQVLAPVPPESVPVLCVRSAWLGLLQALDLPPGSAVLLSALTIPDMVDIVRDCGLRPVPVDLNLDTGVPDIVDLERAAVASQDAGYPLGVVIIVHLFGSRSDLTAHSAWCRQRSLPLVEDAAQAFNADGCWGHTGALASLWSFGVIKTATAGGGGLAVIRCPVVRRRFAQVVAAWPVQKARDARLRLVRTVALHLLGRPGVAAWLYRRGWFSPARVMRRARGFLAGGSRIQRFAQRPNPLLVQQLGRVLRRQTPARRARQVVTRKAWAKRLGSGVVPTCAAAVHAWWVMPVRVINPVGLADACLAQGIGMAMPPGSLAVVPACPGLPHQARMAERLLKSLIVVPVDARQPRAHHLRLAQLITAAGGPEG